MFDDPQKELKRLEEELLLHEQKDEEFERFYHDIFEEFGTAEEEQPRAVAPEAPKKKSAYADTPRAVAPAKKKRNTGLVITLCLEILGILGVAAYWLMKFL